MVWLGSGWCEWGTGPRGHIQASLLVEKVGVGQGSVRRVDRMACPPDSTGAVSPRCATQQLPGTAPEVPRHHRLSLNHPPAPAMPRRLQQTRADSLGLLNDQPSPHLYTVAPRSIPPFLFPPTPSLAYPSVPFRCSSGQTGQAPADRRRSKLLRGWQTTADRRGCPKLRQGGHRGGGPHSWVDERWRSGGLGIAGACPRVLAC